MKSQGIDVKLALVKAKLKDRNYLSVFERKVLDVRIFNFCLEYMVEDFVGDMNWTRWVHSSILPDINGKGPIIPAIQMPAEYDELPNSEVLVKWSHRNLKKNESVFILKENARFHSSLFLTGTIIFFVGYNCTKDIVNNKWVEIFEPVFLFPDKTFRYMMESQIKETSLAVY